MLREEPGSIQGTARVGSWNEQMKVGAPLLTGLLAFIACGSPTTPEAFPG